MANIAGFDFGVQIGRSINKMLFSNQGMIIAHRIKGRRRYTCEALKGCKEACESLELVLKQFPGITTARVNYILGSVTVTYTQSEKTINALFDALSHQLAGKHAVQEETIIPTGALTVGDNINDTLRGVKDRVTKFFNHTEPAFFTRIAGIFFLIYGINRIAFNGDRPAGPQIMLWGLALLLRRSHPDPKLFKEDKDSI